MKVCFPEKKLSFFPCWETKLGQCQAEVRAGKKFLIKCDTVVAHFIVFVTYSVIRSRVDEKHSLFIQYYYFVLHSFLL